MSIRFGIYFYPWYHQKKWKEAPTPHHPLKGLYDSRDPEIVRWQMDLIQKCGFDYVVFEFVPLADWNFEPCSQAIEMALSYLKALNMRWSFLVDVAVLPPAERRIYDCEAMIRDIEKRGWTDGLVRGTTGKPLLMAYAPLPDEAAYVCREFPAYEWRFPIWLPHWDSPDEQFDLPVHRPFAAEARAKNLSIYDSLVAKRYVAFWESSLSPQNFDGYCSIMPGYSDLLLKRTCQLAPEVGRKNGDTFTAQFRNAVKTQPNHILVYSWNEYFEGTVIEPTLEHDHYYLNMMRSLIDEAREQAA